MDCSQQSDHRDFEVGALCGNPGSFKIVIEGEGSSPSAFIGSYAVIYRHAVMKKKLASTRYMEEVIFPPQLVFLGYGY